ncbi:hypothetical protein [Geoglobus ahangari]
MSKYYLIAGTIFVFNLILGMLNAMDLGYKAAHDPTWASKIQEQAGSINSYGGNPITDMIYAIGDYIKMFPVFVQAFFYATVLLPVMLKNWYLPDAIVGPVTAISWYSYVAAAISFISGRDVEK